MSLGQPVALSARGAVQRPRNLEPVDGALLDWGEDLAPGHGRGPRARRLKRIDEEIARHIKMNENAFETIQAPRDMRWPGASSGVRPMGDMLADGLFDPNADSYGL